nr:zinc finger, CCHC-type [Tanacetum cinerariifolium]
MNLQKKAEGRSDKEFLSSRFSMKDMGVADVILGIRIKHESNVSTPLDTCENLMPNRGLTVSQLKYSRVIGCLMYDITCTRPDIAFAVGKSSRYTSNPGTQHWQAIQRVLEYLKKTMNYRLVYSGYPSVVRGYTDASWISNIEDNLSTSGWDTQLPAEKTWQLSLMWKAEHSDRSTCFTNHPKDVLGTCWVLPPQRSWTLGLITFMKWIWTHGYVIVSGAFKCLKACVYLPSGIEVRIVHPERVHSLNDIHQWSLVIFIRGLMASAFIDLSAGMLLSRLADASEN